MESLIISDEFVKPSSPTPLNLRTYQFSMLDQLSNYFLHSCIFYFPNSLQIADLPSFISDTTQKLQRSFSLILTRFYPLAGRPSSDGESIDCNDDGVPFIAARISGRLSDLSRSSDLHFLLPCEISADSERGPNSPLALIKVNYFDCGGIAIGWASDHKIMDAVSLGTIFNSWAAVTRVGPTVPVCPNYILPSLFPPVLGLPKRSYSMRQILKTGNPVVRRFVFDAAAVSALKSGLKGATRVEAVTALIWKGFMAASLANGVSVSAVNHVVNMRNRARPAFTSDCFGNFVAMTVAVEENGDDSDLGVLAAKVREATGKIDEAFVNRMRGDDRLAGERENSKMVWGPVMQRRPDLLYIASWCGFGIYSIDFGWGTPSMVGRCDLWTAPNTKFLNTVWMTDGRNGDKGMEVWVVLDEKYMKVFENVEVLRGFAAPVDQM